MPRDSFNHFIKKVKGVLKNNVFLDNNEKKYILFNQNFWDQKQNDHNKKNNIILVDLFHWYPLIHIWSYLVNILSIKKNAKIKYFYFRSLKRKFANHNIFINKLDKIYKSFNVTKGLSSHDFNFSLAELNSFEKNFEELKKKKSNLNRFKIDGIKLGDLIYDSYLFETKNFTVDFKDPRLKEIFIEANKIYHLCKDYFKKNNVKYVIPSHVCYVPYGIISRLALKKNIKVYKVKSENWCNAFFRLIKIDKKNKVDEHPYFNYKKKFNSFSSRQKKGGLKIGKNILKQRISGKYDKNLPYMRVSQFKKSKIKINLKSNPIRPKIVIFSHCFYDNPHRFRNLHFNDFYEQINFLLNLSATTKKYDWFYKPHPNELKGNSNILIYLKKKFPNLNFLKKNISHRDIIKMKPLFVLTNHGTIAHEYASFKIPVINMGDNPHINYKFCLHAKNKNDVRNIILNFEKFEKKIKFNLNEIYEFLYMHYSFYPNLYDKNKLINDNFFAKKNVKLNFRSSILNHHIKRCKLDNQKIKKYVEDFIKKN